MERYEVEVFKKNTKRVHPLVLCLLVKPKTVLVISVGIRQRAAFAVQSRGFKWVGSSDQLRPSSSKSTADFNSCSAGRFFLSE